MRPLLAAWLNPHFRYFAHFCLLLLRLTDVAKVSSRRAVQELIEEIPGALRRSLANSLASQGAVLVTGTNKMKLGTLGCLVSQFNTFHQ